MQRYECDNLATAQAYVAGRFRRMVAWGAALRGHDDVPSFHWTMADFLEGTRPNWIRRAKVILGGRFLAKSWLGARQYLKWRWLRCPWLQAIVHSSNDRMAGRFVQAIKEELKFDQLTTHLWPRRPGTSDFEFTLEGIVHEQGPSIVAAGIKTSMVGSRADLYIFDDPEPDTDPEAMHDRILQAFGEAGDILHSPTRHLRKMGIAGEILPVPERTQLVVLGQPHCAASAYIPRPEDFEEGAEGHPLVDATCLRIPTTIAGMSLDSVAAWRWPKMMEQKYFNWKEGRPMTPAEVMRTMPTSRWHLQHQVNTQFMLKAGPVLRIKEIELSYRRPTRIILIIDPADSEEGCEWGIAAGGLFSSKIHVSYLGGLQGQAYEGDDWESMGQSVWRQIFDIAAHLQVSEVFLEKNLKAASSACRRYIAKNDVTCVVTEFAARRNKRVRIPENLEPIINNRMMSAHPQVLGDVVNARQMVKLRWDRLPKPNDRIDALSHLVSILVEEPHLWALRDSAYSMPSLASTVEQFSRVESIDSPYQRLER